MYIWAKVWLCRFRTIVRRSREKIVRFSEQIDTQTRTMHTEEVDVKNPKYELVPGMYATVQIPLHTVKDVLTLPTQAVQISSGGRGTVLVVNANSKIEKRDVALGLQSATDTERSCLGSRTMRWSYLESSRSTNQVNW